jgi:hypothetical protein
MTTQRRPLVQLLILVIAAGTLLLISNQNWFGSSAASLQTLMPGPDAQQLFRYITKDNPYNKWKTLPNAPRFLHVKENPHGDWIAVYLNGEAFESISNPPSPFQMRYGSIMVKENYATANGDPPSQPPLTSVPVNLVSLTVMYKVKGYQRISGEEEWFWALYGCNDGQCSGTPATVSNQPWLNEQIPMSQDTFAFYKGEVLAGKPWLCLECHQRASQAGE